MTTRACLLSLIVIGCSANPPPLPVERVPHEPAGDATCEDSCAREADLGCKTYSPYCVADCEYIQSVQGDMGPVKEFDLECQANAKDCEEFARCQ